MKLVSEAFMGNINTLSVYRINDNKTTDYISKWVGTYKA